MSNILIIGGGYVGMYTAYRLEKRLRRGEASVTVVEPQPNMTAVPARHASWRTGLWRCSSAATWPLWTRSNTRAPLGSHQTNTQPDRQVDPLQETDMTVRVQVQETIEASPEAILGLVMDIERYAEVDDKIRPVLWARREGNRVDFACRPKLAGLRQPKVIQFLELTPGRRVDVGLLPKPHNRIAHAMARFEASFECEPVEGGTRVTRTLQFRFSPALRWLMEPLFRRRLESDVRTEVRLAKQHLEAPRAEVRGPRPSGR